MYGLAKEWYDKNYEYPASDAMIAAGQKYGINYYYGNKFRNQLARFHLGKDAGDNTFSAFESRSKNWSTDVAEDAEAIKKGIFVSKITVSESQKGKNDYAEEMKKHINEAGGAEGWKKRFDDNLQKFWKYGLGKSNYGYAREFMLDCGIAHLFDNGSIVGPISWASHILEKLWYYHFLDGMPFYHCTAS